MFRYVKRHYVERHVGIDRPLKYCDRSAFTSHFSNVEFRQSSFLRDIRDLESLDNNLVKIPVVKRYATYITILATK